MLLMMRWLLVWIWGKILHGLLQGVVPGVKSCLPIEGLVGSINLARTRMSLRLGGLLKALMNLYFVKIALSSGFDCSNRVAEERMQLALVWG